MAVDGDREVSEVASGSPDRQPGTIIRAIDRPGRMVVKGQLAPDCIEVVMTYGLDGQILMMAPPVWNAFVARIAGMDQFDPDVEDIVRFQIAPREYCPIDNTGRVRIPEPFRKRAGLETPGVEAQLLRKGDGNFEIWRADRYEALGTERAEAMRETLRAAARRRAQGVAADSG